MKKIFFRLFCCHFFFSFYFLNALQSDNNSNRVYVLGHKYVLGPSQTHFRVESGPKHIYAREHKLYCYINSLLRAVCCKDRLRSARLKKTDFLILCQNEGQGEIVPKTEVSDRSGFSFFFPATFHNLRVAAA